jgi:hypothetical protein
LIRFKTANAKVNQYLGILQDAVASAVDWVSQTIVYEIKKDGAFDKAEQEKAFAEAKAMALRILGEAGLKVLQQASLDVSALITAKIEQRVLFTSQPAK